MSEFLIQHTWKSENTNAVVGVVQSIAGMAQKGQLPAGFVLRSIDVVPGDTRAFCRWQAPNKEALAGLVEKVNPPTEHTVFELQKMS
ncbi:MAG TPA: hypothetical protein VEY12_08705 [Thermoplasmata archaeon]|nr:hypothetical protein [Thermoplasmata archaeon]